MPKVPKGKRTAAAEGSYAVAAKNSNGDGSLYFEPPSVRPDGRVKNGRWRATYRDEQGQLRRVAAPTRVEAERRREGGRHRSEGTRGTLRTVVTALYADGGLDIADIARHVGHVDTATTAEYVRSLGSRPRDTALCAQHSCSIRRSARHALNP